MAMNQKELSVRRAGLIDKGLIYNPLATQLDFTSPGSPPTCGASTRSIPASARHAAVPPTTLDRLLITPI
jgi:hypothetical protein